MKTLRSVLTAIALCLSLGSCLNSSGNQTFADGFYRFVHVSPGADTVAVTANGNLVVPTLSYHGASSYIQLPWGTPPLKIQSTTGGPTYVDTNIPVAGDGHYSYFLYGGGASTVGLSLRDDVGDAQSGQFLLRNIDLATGIGALDVYLLAAGSTVAGSTPIFVALSYGASSPFTAYAVGDYNLVLTPTASKTIVYDSGKQSFGQNAKVSLLVYSTGSAVLVNGALLYNGGAGTTTFVDNPAVRYTFLSATADVPFLDLLIDGSVAIGTVPYGAHSEYAPIAAGNRKFQIQPTGSPGAYVYDHTQSLPGGFDYSLAAFSVPGTGSAGMLYLQDNNIPPPTGSAKLRLVNASSDGTAYDAYANSTKLVSGLVQSGASAYQVLAGGDYTLSFDPAGTTTAAASISTTLAAGHVYTAYVYGRTGAASTVVVDDN